VRPFGEETVRREETVRPRARPDHASNAVGFEGSLEASAKLALAPLTPAAKKRSASRQFLCAKDLSADHGMQLRNG
jgi:hypothetical protein